MKKYLQSVLVVLLTVAGSLAVVAGIGALLPGQHTVTRSSHFRQPPQAIWDVIAGPPTWRPEVKRYEILAPRNGNRTWREIDSHGNSITYEAIEETPPFRLIVHTVESGLPYGGYWIQELTPDPDGCTLQITEDGEIYNPVYRFMSRFIFGYTGTIDGFFKALHAKFGEPGN